MLALCEKPAAKHSKLGERMLYKGLANELDSMTADETKDICRGQLTARELGLSVTKLNRLLKPVPCSSSPAAALAVCPCLGTLVRGSAKGLGRGPVCRPLV